MGYSAFRLCSISKDLVLGEPIELDNEESEDPAGHCTWNVTFNLTVPGWLPATTPFGETGGGTQYALHASVAFDYVDDSAQRSWFSIFCSPLRFFSKTLKARVPVHLNRYTCPSLIASSSTSAFPPSLFAVTSRMEQVDEQSNFPADILSKILVQVSIPECIGMEEDNIPFTLRLRTDLPEADCAKLRATAFSVDVEQIERYRYARSIVWLIVSHFVTDSCRIGPFPIPHIPLSILYHQPLSNHHTKDCAIHIPFKLSTMLGSP